MSISPTTKSGPIFSFGDRSVNDTLRIKTQRDSRSDVFVKVHHQMITGISYLSTRTVHFHLISSLPFHGGWAIDESHN